MGHHLTKDGRFKSDKYPWCPPGYFPLSFNDILARQLISTYALRTSDKELSDDLFQALKKPGSISHEEN